MKINNQKDRYAKPRGSMEDIRGVSGRGAEARTNEEKPPINATNGRQYDATMILQRLKYLRTIIQSPGTSKESKFEAEREESEIFSKVAD